MCVCFVLLQEGCGSALAEVLMHQHLEERLRYHQAVEDALLDAASKSSAEGVKATTVAAAVTRVRNGGEGGLP